MRKKINFNLKIVENGHLYWSYDMIAWWSWVNESFGVWYDGVSSACWFVNCCNLKNLASEIWAESRTQQIPFESIVFHVWIPNLLCNLWKSCKCLWIEQWSRHIVDPSIWPFIEKFPNRNFIFRDNHIEPCSLFIEKPFKINQNRSFNTIRLWTHD